MSMVQFSAPAAKKTIEDITDAVAGLAALNSDIEATLQKASSQWISDAASVEFSTLKAKLDEASDTIALQKSSGILTQATQNYLNAEQSNASATGSILAAFNQR